MSQRLEAPVPALDLRVGETLHPVETEVLHVERGHHAAEDDGLPDPLVGEVAGVGQVPHQAPSKGIPGPRGIVDLFQGVRRRGEERIRGEHQDSVLAPLDDQPLAPQADDPAGSLDQVGLAGELTRLPLINDHHIHLPEHLLERLRLGADPEVHGVAGDQSGIADLAQNL